MLNVRISARPGFPELIRMICMNCARAVSAVQSQALDENNVDGFDVSIDSDLPGVRVRDPGTEPDLPGHVVDAGSEPEQVPSIDRSELEATTGSEGEQEKGGVTVVDRAEKRRLASHKRQTDNS